MRAHFSLPSVMCEDTEGKPPIHVKFEIPYFTVSGIQVSNLLLCSLVEMSPFKIIGNK
jgi:AP-1 complex subunit mu